MTGHETAYMLYDKFIKLEADVEALRREVAATHMPDNPTAKPSIRLVAGDVTTMLRRAYNQRDCLAFEMAISRLSEL